MQRAWPIGVLLLLACGRPEDVLHIEGRLVLLDGGPAPAQSVMFFRDEGQTDFGCTRFSPWHGVTTGNGGAIDLQHVREETDGRFGAKRCLRLQWSEGLESSNLSWVARDRDTVLPELMTLVTPFDDGFAFPYVDAGVVSILSSTQVLDDSGVIFRSATATGPGSGPGFEPSHGQNLITRSIVRRQQLQPDGIAQNPELPVEYRVEVLSPTFDSPTTPELAHGSPCNVARDGGACALTDGLFTPIDLTPAEAGAVAIVLPQMVPITWVVVRGLWSTQAFTRVVIEGRPTDSDSWEFAGAQRIDPGAELSSMSSAEDARALLFPVVRWDIRMGPVSQVRVRLTDDQMHDVPISWVAEVSLY